MVWWFGGLVVWSLEDSLSKGLEKELEFKPQNEKVDCLIVKRKSTMVAFKRKPFLRRRLGSSKK